MNIGFEKIVLETKRVLSVEICIFGSLLQLPIEFQIFLFVTFRFHQTWRLEGKRSGLMEEFMRENGSPQPLCYTL